jgi:uroporphyrinogen decarboxylase
MTASSPSTGAFAPLQNDSFLRACLRQATDHTPVWLMRQAGRYLPEYRDTRAKAGSFMGLATNTDYATEVTLQPLDRYPLDAAILFSDILTVPDAMGLGLSFALGEGPKFARRCATRPPWRRWPCPTWTSCATCSMPSHRSGAR